MNVRHNHRSRILALSGAIALVIVGNSVRSGAIDKSTDASPPDSLTVDNATVENEMINDFARRNGYQVSEVLRGATYSRQLTDFLAEVKERDDFATLRLYYSPDFHVRLGSVRGTQSPLVAMFQSKFPEVRLEAVELPYSHSTLMASVETLGRAAQDVGLKGDYSVSINSDDDGLVLGYDDAAAEATARSLTGRVQVPVAVEQRPASERAKPMSMGGRETRYSNNQPHCTASFVMKRTLNGVTKYGIATAAHCYDFDMRYYNSAGAVLNLPYPTSWQCTPVDYQIHEIPASEKSSRWDWIYARDNPDPYGYPVNYSYNQRSIEGVVLSASLPPGSLVVKNGRQTMAMWTTVESWEGWVTVTPPAGFTGGCAASYQVWGVQVNGQGIPGDSGGGVALAITNPNGSQSYHAVGIIAAGTEGANGKTWYTRTHDIYWNWGGWIPCAGSNGSCN